MPRRRSDTIVGRLKAHDPFELIRWLARSQPDPRKALAELVQNSLDAGARTIRITRLRERGVTILRILDDGEGVIPGLERTEALAYLATHIGYSRKRNLTPEERRELMMQGKYGIGLLGFWAIGETMEIRTHTPGAPAFLLRLHEEEPRYEIEQLRGRLALDERSTEVVIRGVHRAALGTLTGRRIADYLAAELRGQLLQREVQIVVHDRVARGRAPKVLEVRPTRFEGERLPLPDTLPAGAFTPVRVELYLLPDGASGKRSVSISQAGTIVYDDLADFEAADFRHPPWTEPRVTGLLDFSDFQVPPGSRRGVVPDEAALAFAEAVRSLEPLVTAEFAAARDRAAAEVGADLLRQLERAFREVARLAPEYDLLCVRTASGDAGPSRDDGASHHGSAANGEVPPAAGGLAVDVGDANADEAPAPLLPAGPLHVLEIVPAATRVERLGFRRFRAIARDAFGNPMRRALDVLWTTDGALGRMEPARGTAVQFVAGPDVGTAAVVAEAREGERFASGRASVEIVDIVPGSDSARTGVPEPRVVEEPGAPWRSRLRDGAWEVNGAHRDFRQASETPRRKLRYLAQLLAKEVLLHSFPSPQLGPALERLVEVLTITERKLDRG